jgi:hypothetical protein
MLFPYQLPLILALLAPFLIRLLYGRRLPRAALWLASLAVCYLLLIAALWLRDAQPVLDGNVPVSESDHRLTPVIGLIIAAAYHLIIAALFAFMRKWQRR